VLTSSASGILSTLFANIKGPSSCPEMFHVLLFLSLQKVLFYFSPFTSFFANPPPHITSPTLSITRSISPVFCKQLVSRKLAHFVCAFHRWDGFFSTSCLSFTRTTAHCSSDLWTDPEEETCGCLMKVDSECLMKVDRYPLQGGERGEGMGKRVKCLCKSGIIIFTERKRHLST
jgi:hypothetical protein